VPAAYLIYFLLENVSQCIDIMLKRVIRVAREQFWYVGVISSNIPHESSCLRGDVVTVPESNEVIADDVVSAIQWRYPRHAIGFAKVCHEVPASGYNRLCVHHDMFSGEVAETKIVRTEHSRKREKVRTGVPRYFRGDMSSPCVVVKRWLKAPVNGSHLQNLRDELHDLSHCDKLRIIEPSQNGHDHVLNVRCKRVDKYVVEGDDMIPRVFCHPSCREVLRDLDLSQLSVILNHLDTYDQPIVPAYRVQNLRKLKWPVSTNE